MSLAVVYSRACVGIQAPEVTVEAHISGGLPRFTIVGLPEAAVKESKDRVRSVLLNAKFEFPARRITVNLAPADLPKMGGRFDLPIALSILVASKQLPALELSELEFAGELTLSGELRPIMGCLPHALAAAKVGRTLVIPWQNADEAALPDKAIILPAKHLFEICAHLKKESRLVPYKFSEMPMMGHAEKSSVDLVDVKGQPQARRALEIAAAGNHSLLMVGPPGAGKTMLATRLVSILPPMMDDEALETAAVQSISSSSASLSAWRVRPFRAPHHTASAVALVGGGSPPRPGEISLAHHGVLFLDELPEFNRRVLETLREPLESGQITISRAAWQSNFPAQFQLIAAMNPCPCGHLGNPNRECQCSAQQIQRYHARISGPLLDRIDLHLEIAALSATWLSHANVPIETSEQVRVRTLRAREIQVARVQKANAQMTVQETEQYCKLSASDCALLAHAIQKLGLSARSYHRILRVARTIADLAGVEQIATTHLTEALGYRKLDRLRD